MSALAWTGVMIIIGVILRAKVKFLKSNLVPASVVGGLIGFAVMNLGLIPDCTVGQYFVMPAIIAYPPSRHDRLEQEKFVTIFF